MPSTVRASMLLALALSSPAWAARVAPAGISASSNYPEEEGVAYDAGRASDGKLSTSWVEGEQGSGLGSWVEIDLGGEHTVKELKIWGGLWVSGDFWKRANRPKDVEVQYSDGSKDTFTLKNEMKAQDFVLPTPKKTSTVRVRVKSVYDGNTWLDTAISEVQVFDDAPDKGVPVKAYAASSQLPADGDGSYDAANVADGILDSMWCEGNKTGDGTGEALTFDFGGAKQVSSLTIVDGMAGSMAVWMKGNRAGAATLTFSDGSTQQITLKNAMLPQTVAFTPVTTSSVRMTFSGVVKGKEYNDLCISEAYFNP